MAYTYEQINDTLRGMDRAFPFDKEPYWARDNMYGKSWRKWERADLKIVLDSNGGAKYLSGLYYALESGSFDPRCLELAKRYLPDSYRNNFGDRALIAFGHDLSKTLRAPVPQVIADLERGIVPVGYQRRSEISPELQQELLQKMGGVALAENQTYQGPDSLQQQATEAVKNSAIRAA